MERPNRLVLKMATLLQLLNNEKYVNFILLTMYTLGNINKYIAVTWTFFKTQNCLKNISEIKYCIL